MCKRRKWCDKKCDDCAQSYKWGLHTLYCELLKKDVSCGSKACDNYITAADKVTDDFIYATNTEAEIEQLERRIRQLSEEDAKKVLLNLADLTKSDILKKQRYKSEQWDMFTKLQALLTSVTITKITLDEIIKVEQGDTSSVVDTKHMDKENLATYIRSFIQLHIKEIEEMTHTIS